MIPADCIAVLAGLPSLDSVDLSSSQPLPDVQPLTALTELYLLTLEEGQTNIGLAVLPAEHFPGMWHVTYKSPLLRVSMDRSSAPLMRAIHARVCVAHSDRCTLCVLLSCVAPQVDDMLYPASRGGPGKAFLDELSVWRLKLERMHSDAHDAFGQLVRALKPAGEPVQQLQLRQCTVSDQAWSPGGELAAVTALLCHNLAATHTGLPAALSAGLQHMASLCTLEIRSCELSSGTPAALHQLPMITSLPINGCMLRGLPPLACMTGEWCGEVDARQSVFFFRSHSLPLCALQQAPRALDYGPQLRSAGEPLPEVQQPHQGATSGQRSTSAAAVAEGQPQPCARCRRCRPAARGGPSAEGAAHRRAGGSCGQLGQKHATAQASVKRLFACSGPSSSAIRLPHSTACLRHSVHALLPPACIAFYWYDGCM